MVTGSSEYGIDENFFILSGSTLPMSGSGGGTIQDKFSSVVPFSRLPRKRRFFSGIFPKLVNLQYSGFDKGKIAMAQIKSFRDLFFPNKEMKSVIEYMYREAFINRLLYLLNLFATSVIFLFFCFDYFLVMFS